MKHFTLLVICCIFFMYSFAQKEVLLNTEKTQAEIVSLSESEIILKNSISNFTIDEVKTIKGDFFSLNIANYTSESKKGMPKLPFYHQLIEIPTGAEIEIQILSQKNSQ